MEWHLRITDDGEGPIRTELSGTMKSGLTVTFNGENNTQLSLAQHRQHSRTNLKSKTYVKRQTGLSYNLIEKSLADFGLQGFFFC